MATYDSIKYNVIADGAVTVSKLTDNTVTADDLNSTLDISSKTVTLPNASVTNDMLAGSIDVTSKITGALPVARGGTGLTSLGSAGQGIKVNSGATALEYGDTAGSGNEIFTSNQDNVGSISAGNQVGNALSFTPSISGTAIFSGKVAYRHTNTTYAYFYPRNSSTKLHTWGSAHSASSTGHNQGAQWHVVYGSVSSGTSYNANLYYEGGATINQASDDGDDLNLIINIIP